MRSICCSQKTATRPYTNDVKLDELMGISKDYISSKLSNLLNNLTTKCEMFQSAIYTAILTYVGIPLSNKIRLLHRKTPSNIYFNYIGKLPLKLRPKTVLEFEMLTNRPTKLGLHLSSKYFGCIKAILSQPSKIAPCLSKNVLVILLRYHQD